MRRAPFFLFIPIFFFFVPHQKKISGFAAVYDLRCLLASLQVLCGNNVFNIFICVVFLILLVLFCFSFRLVEGVVSVVWLVKFLLVA